MKLTVHWKTGRCLDPKRLIIDFEASLKAAVETEFPNASISGYNFHFCSSLWRKIQKVGLCNAYKRDSSFRKSVRMIMAAALVRNNFNLFCDSRRTNSLLHRYPAFQSWITYVSSTYIANNATFPTPMWNVFTGNINMRSNNHLEGIVFIYKTDKV